MEHGHGGNVGGNVGVAEFVVVCSYHHAQCGSKEGIEGCAAHENHPDRDDEDWVKHTLVFNKDEVTTEIKLDEDDCKMVEPVARVY